MSDKTKVTDDQMAEAPERQITTVTLRKGVTAEIEHPWDVFFEDGRREAVRLFVQKRMGDAYNTAVAAGHEPEECMNRAKAVYEKMALAGGPTSGAVFSAGEFTAGKAVFGVTSKTGLVKALGLATTERRADWARRAAIIDEALIDL